MCLHLHESFWDTNFAGVCANFLGVLAGKFCESARKFCEKNVVSFWDTNFAGVCVCQFFGRACTKVLRK